MSKWLTALAISGILTAGILSIWVGTEGGLAWTAESARRLEIRRQPLLLDNYPLQSTKGGESTLVNNSKSLQIVDFIYTSCPDVCLAMGAEFRDLQTVLSEFDPANRVQLVSLTFDQENDSIEQLQGYLEAFGAIGARWSAAKFSKSEDLHSVLDELGVVVIPNEPHGFVHNAAFYLVVSDSVVGIFNIDDTSQLIEEVKWHLSQLGAS